MLLDLLLVITLAICVITDIRSRKIYNIVIFPALLITLFLQLVLGGWQALGASLLGFLIGFSILIIPYLLGGIGAGDVKLLALIGALKGGYFVFTTALYMALLGGGIALLILLFRSGVKKRLQSIVYGIYSYRYGIRLPLLNKEDLKMTYPYGVAIAGGAVLCLWI